MEQVDVLLPSSFNDTYEKYNQIQKEQGLDLLKYAGATCQRYTYEVTNYPGKDSGVVANLLVLDGRVIGGDICSVELNGFIHGFVNPNDTASLTQVSPLHKPGKRQRILTRRLMPPQRKAGSRQRWKRLPLRSLNILWKAAQSGRP